MKGDEETAGNRPRCSWLGPATSQSSLERQLELPVGEVRAASMKTPRGHCTATGSGAPPLASVILCTRNHERSVRKAVRSILRQDVDFDFEIIIADNHSRDRTLEIARYETSALTNVRYLTTDDDLDASANCERAVAVSSGSYISFLDAAGYWSSATRLRDQVRYLDAHWECALVMGLTCRLQENRGEFEILPTLPCPNRAISLLSASQLAGAGFGASSAATYRTEPLKRLPKHPNVFGFDELLHVLLAQSGPVAFMDEVHFVLPFAAREQPPAYRKRVEQEVAVVSELIALERGRFGPSLEQFRLRKLECLDPHFHDARMRPEELGVLDRAVRDFAPPAVLQILKSFMPPIILRHLARILTRNENAPR